MDADAFENLAMRILTDDASPREQAEFEQALAQNPALREEFEELKAAREAFREFGPLVGDRDHQPAPLSSAQHERLQQAVAQSQADRRADGPRPHQSPTGDPHRTSEAKLVRLVRERRHLAGIWAAAAAIVLLAGGFWASRFFRPAGDDTPVAYLATAPAGLEVRRAGRPLPLTPSTALQRADQVMLPAGSTSHYAA